jgi:hypothetical protein
VEATVSMTDPPFVRNRAPMAKINARTAKCNRVRAFHDVFLQDGDSLTASRTVGDAVGQAWAPTACTLLSLQELDMALQRARTGTTPGPNCQGLVNKVKNLLKCFKSVCMKNRRWDCISWDVAQDPKMGVSRTKRSAHHSSSVDCKHKSF